MSGNAVGIALGVIVTLWLASMGLAVKLTILMTTVVSELKDVKRQNRINAANIANIQNRFNIPQVISQEDDDCDIDFPIASQA